MSTSCEDTVIEPPVQEFADAFFAGPENSFPMSFGATSHVGKVRSQNQDHFAIIRRRRTTEILHASLSPEELTVPEASSYALVVADGLGGMRSGELASRLALQTMLELAGQATSWVMKLTDPDAQQIEQRVNAYVERIHATLRQYSESHPATVDMGTTWTSAHLLGQQAVIVHLGDSRAYLFRDGQLQQITRDETLAQSLIDGGLEAETVSRFRHVLLNSFGGGNEVARATIHHLELSADDQLLLCSDGLTDMLADDAIADALRQHTHPQAACDALIERALANGGKDNVTVVLAYVRTAQD